MNQGRIWTVVSPAVGLPLLHWRRGGDIVAGSLRDPVAYDMVSAAIGKAHITRCR